MKNCENRVFVNVADGIVLANKDVLSSEYEGLKRLIDANQNTDLMFISFILKHEGPNTNGDYFTRDEIEQSWITYVGKPITWKHKQPFIGHITDVVLVKPEEDEEDQRWHVRCAGVVWKTRYPEQAKVIYDSALEKEVNMSMETYFSDVVYALGEDLEEIYTKEEAPFLEKFVGRKYQGKPVYRVLIGCHGAGVGVVEDPADEDAIFLSVANEDKSGVEANKEIVIDNKHSSAYLLVANIDDYTKEEVLGMANEERILDNEQEDIQENASNEQLEADKETTEEVAVVEEEAIEETEATEEDVVEEETIDEVEVADEDVIEEVEITEGTEVTEKDVDEEVEVSEDEVEEIVEASLVVEFLNQRLRGETFWSVFEELREAIYCHMANFKDEEGFKGAVNKELQSFVDVLNTILPGLLEDWGMVVEATATKQLKENLSRINTELVTATSELNEIKEEFTSYKEEIESGKAEAQKDALAEQRLEGLAEAGVEISESSKNKWFARIREMDEDTFGDLSEILIESASATKKTETEPDDEIATANVVIPNLEQVNDVSATRVNKFEQMWEAALKK